MTQEQFISITKWQNKTFGKATPLSKIAHLAEEIQELVDAIKDIDHTIDFKKERAKKLEWADCFILLFGAAASDGMSYQDIIDSIDDKMVINKNRTWGKPKENGVVNHIKND